MCPCIIYTGGRMHPDAKGMMHAVGEHVHVDDLVTAAKVYLDAALVMQPERYGLSRRLTRRMTTVT